MKALLIAFVCSFLISSSVLADYIEEKDLSIPADKVQELKIDCGAGFLEIEGVEELDNIEVNAEIVIEHMSKKKAMKYVEEYMELELEGKGKYARLRSGFEHDKISLFSSSSLRSAVINLTVRMPKNISLDISDGSGYIAIQNMDNDIFISDGSGEITAEKINGHLDISDGSGSVELRKIVGNVQVKDGSGSVNIRDVEGDVEIDDGSGEIVVRLIDGNVVVDDGSGSIRIDRVTQDVAIINEGSGGCSISNVDGRVRRH